MSNPLLQLPWEPCLLEPVQDRALARRLKREAGDAPGWSRYYWTSPWFAKAAIRLDYSNGLLRALHYDLALLVGLVVSRENSCRYCYAAVRASMRMLGIEEARVQAIENELARNELDPRRAAAAQFARAVNRGHRLDGRRERERLTAVGYSAEEIRELAFVAVTMGFMNRLTTIVALSPTGWEHVPDRWYIRLLLPVLTPLAKRLMQRRRPATAVVAESPMSAQLLACYAGSPIQSVLADGMRDLWVSEGLPLRTKLLMFATIAQGIECAVCTQEITRLAGAAGIDVEMLDRFARHLDDPALLAIERDYCEFARESLWYEPQLIQRRARALYQRIDAPTFVEVLAMVALGNLLMRLIATMVDVE